MLQRSRRAAALGLLALACLAPASLRAQQPQISDVSPASVPVGTGDFTLTINGAGFAPNARVQFNGAGLAGARVTPTQIVVRVPVQYISQDPFVTPRDLASGRMRIGVIVINGPLSDSPSAQKAFYLTRDAAPVEAERPTMILGAVSPAVAPMGGSFRVEGNHLDAPQLGVSLVARDPQARISSWGRDRHLFNRSATSFMVGTAEVPAGSYLLVIEGYDEKGRALGRFERPVVVGVATALGAPTITALGPQPFLPGHRLTITGTNFADDAQVVLRPASSQPPMTLAPAANTTRGRTSITVVIPAGVYPGPHTVRVANANGGAVEQQIVIVHPGDRSVATWKDNDGRPPVVATPAAPPVRPGTARPERRPVARPAPAPARNVGRRWDDPVNFSANLEEPDYGIYWFRNGTDGRKSLGARQNDDYFRPDRPTVIYVHGWQKGTHENKPTAGVIRLRESFDFGGVNVIEGWKKPGREWNVGIFYWDAWANEDELSAPHRAEAKIWAADGYKGMRWRRWHDGSFVEGFQMDPVRNAGDLFVQAYLDAVGNATSPEIRIVGHSLGNQMAVRLTKVIATKVDEGGVPARLLPKRVALLDPYWSGGGKPYLDNAAPGALVLQYVRQLKAKGVVFEHYQSSNINDIGGGDKNHEMQSATAYMRLDPDWIRDWNPLGVGDLLKRAHGAAIEWYFRSMSTGVSLCVRENNQLVFRSTRLPSAAMPTAELRGFMNDGGYTWYRQAWGEDDPETSRDCFERQQ